MKMTINSKFTGLPMDKILQEVNAIEMEALVPMKAAIQEVLVKNVGTQYFSLAELKALKHPYRIGGPGGMPKGIVNLQTGGFFASFRIRGPLAGRDRNTVTVYNTGGYKVLGEWLLYGTKRMQGRPWAINLYTEIYKVTEPFMAEMTKRLRLRVRI